MRATSVGGGGALACLILLIVLMAAVASASPASAQAQQAASPYYDYDGARDLYEALLQREADGGGRFASAYGFGRVRKNPNSRSPSLRLRFGKRPDPALSLYQLERGLLQSDDN